MDKIYTRRRFRILNKKKMNTNFGGYKSSSIYCITMALVIAIITTRVLISIINPIFGYVASNKVKSLATIITNEKATEVIRRHTYDEMFTIEKDINDNISMVKSNVITINQITSDVAVGIQQELDQLYKEKISLPLGSFTGISWLSGSGPDVEIDVRPVGVVETKLESEFVSVAINQTVHRIYLNVICEIGIITPYDQTVERISNQVLLIENIIVGIVPSTNYDLDGLDKSDAIEVME